MLLWLSIEYPIWLVRNGIGTFGTKTASRPLLSQRLSTGSALVVGLAEVLPLGNRCWRSPQDLCPSAVGIGKTLHNCYP